MKNRELSNWNNWSFALHAIVVVGFAASPIRADDTDLLHTKFKELQAAVQAKDADKLWDLLSSKSRNDAEKTAREMRESYAKASPIERSKQEKTLGLNGKDISQLTGKEFLKSATVWKKLRELPESKIARVVIGSDNATVHYLETDGDKEKLIFVRQDNEWKAWLILPRLVDPKVLGKPATKDR